MVLLLLGPIIFFATIINFIAEIITDSSRFPWKLKMMVIILMLISKLKSPFGDPSKQSSTWIT